MKHILTALVISCICLSVGCNKDDDPVPDPLLTQAVLKFNNNLNDSTNKSGTPVVTGIVTYVADRNGVPSSALYLNGFSKVTYPTISIKGTALTISAWVKYTNVMTMVNFLWAGNNTDGAWYGFSQTNDRYRVSISTPFTSGALGPVADNGWHHIAATYDGVNINFYSDGALTTTNYPGTMGDTVQTLVLGFFVNNYWTGAIDDVRIYNTVLTAAQIAAL
jgi:hypothetical protein